MKRISTHEKGQGLVEYALILVLVAIVIIAILLLLGPTVGNVFSDIVVYIKEGRGVITSVSAARTGVGGTGNDVDVTITVSTNTSVTVSDSQNADPVTASCNGSCTVTLSAVGHNAGTATVRAAAGGIATASYPAKP
jgi:pilus assembly protein Flp/PilA